MNYFGRLNKMKSWLTILLPKDEYKEKVMLYFLAEGTVILLLALVGMLVYSNYFNITITNALLISILIFIMYVTGRYSTSGIEYTNVSTYKAYKKESKAIVSRTIVFFVMLVLLYLLLEGIGKWLNLVLLILAVSIIWFLMSFISLKRSYHKNKDVL